MRDDPLDQVDIGGGGRVGRHGAAILLVYLTWW
jgi:hypothetical protein